MVVVLKLVWRRRVPYIVIRLMAHGWRAPAELLAFHDSCLSLGRANCQARAGLCAKGMRSGKAMVTSRWSSSCESKSWPCEWAVGSVAVGAEMVWKKIVKQAMPRRSASQDSQRWRRVLAFVSGGNSRDANDGCEATTQPLELQPSLRTASSSEILILPDIL